MKNPYKHNIFKLYWKTKEKKVLKPEEEKYIPHRKQEKKLYRDFLSMQVRE